jgi:hypothetical protein
MAPQIQWREPQEFSAGDTLTFERNLPDYPATAGWSLDYELRGGAQVISFQSTPDGNSHKVNLAPAVTSLWAPGDYTLTGYAILAATGERHRIYYGEFKLWEDKQTATADAPEKTFAQQMVEQIKLCLLAKAGNDLASSKLGETEFRYMTYEQLNRHLGEWMGVRRQEIAKENARAGRPTGNKIRPRINVSPSGPVFGSQWPTGYGGW